ncbi:methionine--tRNA ligase [Intrasporangium oryzae NRRL B-24470]|uniref:Methionine--tRNA ligase n=1 Tax=Intrasporangium oryzae NRRL B-24470 TaxID=1386089 RepID=W9G8K8_9MICO|nr:methionine--tRNA ligase [Intrasporangium oryzae]EWT01577.1 methionine--tRNA ligase [Intrasporangium oryzae NRRL B-24470]
MSKVLSAVAWPYTNGPRHIGHVAGFGVPSDVFSRYMRMAGHDVLMVSGTDEHGTPILVLAEEEGLTPQELVDKYNEVIARDLTDLGLSYDLFTRTTTRNHYAVVQEMFRQVHANGYMIEQTTKGAISPSTGRTLPDRYIEGTCPICGFPEARGDQCDNCGNQLDADELINPRSKINGETPEFIETQHFFLDLPALADALGVWLDEREASGTWRPNVIKFSKNLLKDVRPRAMTRDIDWGIPIPLEGWEDNPTKRLYVWFDAVIGYLSASIEWARRQGDPERWREWWNEPEAVSYYFQGKDNITFHSQIWPAELLGYAGRGDKGGEPGPYGVLNLPTEVVASEFMTLEGKQFSTSRKHVIYVKDIVARYGPDPIRYFICAAGPENQDADFSWAEFVQRNNSELVAGWGNLVNRTAAMIAKNFGEIPPSYAVEPVDEELLATVSAGFEAVGGFLERHRQKAALAEVMRIVGEANAYVSKTEPFKLKGDDERERLATVLHTLVQAVSDINTLIAPFLPHAANRVHAVLGGEGVFMPMPRLDVVADLDDGSRSYPVITGDYSMTPRWESRPVLVGTPIAKPTGVFTKLDPEQVIADERARLGDAAPGRTRHHTDPLAAPKMGKPKHEGRPEVTQSGEGNGVDEGTAQATGDAGDDAGTTA